MTKDELYHSYAEVIARRLGVRIDCTEALLRSLDPVPAEAYSQLVDKLAPIEREQGQGMATNRLIDMIVARGL